MGVLLRASNGRLQFPTFREKWEIVCARSVGRVNVRSNEILPQRSRRLQVHGFSLIGQPRRSSQSLRDGCKRKLLGEVEKRGGGDNGRYQFFELLPGLSCSVLRSFLYRRTR